MKKNGMVGLHVVLLILIILLIILLITLWINENLFYLIVLVSFYFFGLHLCENSKWDNVHPAVNHLLVFIVFSLQYAAAVKSIFLQVFGFITPNFENIFAENIYLAVITIVALNVIDIIIRFLNFVIKQSAKEIE